MSLAGHPLELPVIGKSTSRVGFGTGGLLRIGSSRRRQDTLAAALASGITHFDTAPLYGFGESERALGQFLRGRRDQITLTTKFGLQAAPLAARLAVFQRLARGVLNSFPALRKAAVRNAGALYKPPSFSLPEARASLERSLRALQTDHVDFFLAHQASAVALPDDEVLGWLEDVRRDGKILAFGVATDFDWLLPVLRERPTLAHVVQFDNDLMRQNASSVGSTGRLLITYGFIGRAITLCRERLTDTRLARTPWLERVDDDELGALLLRAAVLANPGGIVLMQSRSVARIERNVRIATSGADDERVAELVNLLASPA
jgi:aryl-alcohol dehydrogenase-like predicted oxidoreductase